MCFYFNYLALKSFYFVTGILVVSMFLLLKYMKAETPNLVLNIFPVIENPNALILKMSMI